MATNHLARPHYTNAIMLNLDGTPMTTIGMDKVEWYLTRGLATKVTYPGYDSAIRLTFQARCDGDPTDLVRMDNRCVICGREDTLSLHHVVPYSVKRHYPLRDKEHSRRQCVLLCETHHLEIEGLNRSILPDPYAPIEGHLRWINRVVGLYTRWLKRWAVRAWRWRAGGVKAINKRYIDLFMTTNPQHLPKGWLK